MTYAAANKRKKASGEKQHGVTKKMACVAAGEIGRKRQRNRKQQSWRKRRQWRNMASAKAERHGSMTACGSS